MADACEHRGVGRQMELLGLDQRPEPSKNQGLDLFAPAQMPPWVPRAIALFFVGAIAAVATLRIVALLRNLLVMLLVAAFVSFGMEPAVSWLAKRGWRRGAATGLVFLGVLVGGTVTVVLVGGLLLTQLAQLVSELPQLVSRSVEWVNQTFKVRVDIEGLQQFLVDADSPIRGIASNAAGKALDITTSALGVLFNLLAIGLFSYYLTADGPRFRRTICSFLPGDKQRRVLQGWEVAIDKTGGYLYSRALLALIAGGITAIFLVIVGVPYPLALALWLGITSQFVPTIGTYIGGALPVLIAFFASPGKGLATLIFLVIYQQFENLYLSPRITSKTMDLHPAVAFATVIGGAALLGAAGALLALPAAAVVQAIGSTAFRRHEVIDSDMFGEAEMLARQKRRPLIARLLRRVNVELPGALPLLESDDDRQSESRAD